ILEAYRNILPPTVFPVVLLFLDLPSGEVDVNVHPSKTEVRFRQQSVMHDFVRALVRAPEPAPDSMGNDTCAPPIADEAEGPGDLAPALASLKPLGQIRESFILAVNPEGLWIVDRHVAHERVLFEKILKQR